MGEGSMRQATPSDADRPGSARRERAELVDHLEALLEPIMAVLGLVFLALVIVDLAQPPLPPGDQALIDAGTNAIYAIFIVDFAVRFALVPSKGAFLRDNWLIALSLVLPAVRAFGALRALVALRSIQLVRFVGGANRGLRALRAIVGRHRLAYLGIVSALVVLFGAAGVVLFERPVAASPVGTFSEALWWSATLITTINIGEDPVTAPGRLIALLLRVYAISVFAYLAGSVASYFVSRGDDALGSEGEAPSVGGTARAPAVRGAPAPPDGR